MREWMHPTSALVPVARSQVLAEFSCTRYHITIAVQALVTLLRSGWHGGLQPSDLTEHQACVNVAMPVLLRTLLDYTTDQRGDVGSMCAAS